MRVRYIGDARFIHGIGAPVHGQDYDWPDDVCASLIEQGKCIPVPVVAEAPAPKAPVGIRSRKIVSEEE